MEDNLLGAVLTELKFQILFGIWKIFQSSGPQPSISRSKSGIGRSKSFRYSPIPEVDLEQLWNQRHPTCNYFKSFSGFSENYILNKHKPNEG